MHIVIIGLGTLFGVLLVLRLAAYFIGERVEKKMEEEPLIRENVKIIQVDKTQTLNVHFAKVLVQDEMGNRRWLKYQGEATFVAGDEGALARKGEFILTFKAIAEGGQK